MKIMFSGGGTLGPVTPLLSIAETCRSAYPNTQFVWVGTKNGPEKTVIEVYKIIFYPIGAGKWRRYWSWHNISDLFRIVVAFFQSLLLLWHERPDILISAGGFVSVPLHFAGWLLGIPSWIHQQDIRVGLATRLMVPFAKKITVALKESIDQLPKRKTEWIGNPARDLNFPDRSSARRFFHLTESDPVIFALGGGTGSQSVNEMVLHSLSSLPKNYQVIHLTGKERSGEMAERAMNSFPNYHVFKFFTDEMKMAYAAADVVIARAGFGTLTELAMLSKTSVIIPMTGTHQEENATFLANHKAVVVLHQELDNGLKLAKVIQRLIELPDERAAFGIILHGVLPRAEPKKILDIIDKIVGK
jgi:UDP-N-acetylglucosamine--N-acetylmuramyl-(pentapeptide) pyrophosphoryl-undecaprenol N-acetylglucosamine transferase